MRYSLLCLLLLASPASAECMQWKYDAHGNGACVQDDLVNRSPYIFDYTIPSEALITRGVTTNSGSPIFSCKPDEEAVLRSNGHYGCAKEVHE